MRSLVRSPPGFEFENDAHSVMCSEHISRAFSRVVGRAAVGSFSSKIERASVDASDKYRKKIPDKKDEPNTLEAEVTSLPTIPTQSRLSANDTTPHLRKRVVNNTSSLCFWEKEKRESPAD